MWDEHWWTGVSGVWCHCFRAGSSWYPTTSDWSGWFVRSCGFVKAGKFTASTAASTSTETSCRSSSGRRVTCEAPPTTTHYINPAPFLTKTPPISTSNQLSERTGGRFFVSELTRLTWCRWWPAASWLVLMFLLSWWGQWTLEEAESSSTVWSLFKESNCRHI